MNCTYCGGSKFYEGPSGGLSTNVLCVNPECRHWFNYTDVLNTMEDLNSVEPSDAEKEALWVQRKKEQDEWPARTTAEGRDIYLAGESALECATDHGAITYSSVVRLCGFIDAMLKDFRQIKNLESLKEKP